VEELLAVIEQLIGKGEPGVAKGELGNTKNLTLLGGRPS